MTQSTHARQYQGIDHQAGTAEIFKALLPEPVAVVRIEVALQRPAVQKIYKNSKDEEVDNSANPEAFQIQIRPFVFDSVSLPGIDDTSVKCGLRIDHLSPLSSA